MTDFRDPAQVNGIYMPEIVDLVQRLTGAEKVLTFGTMRRTDSADADDGSLPAHGAHVDYGDFTVRQTATEMLGDEAEKWLSRRYMLINLWRPIRTVERTPAGLVRRQHRHRRRSVRQTKCAAASAIPTGRRCGGFNLAYDPAQRWYYAPRMAPDEIFAFKLFDSDRSRVQFTAHSAFADPTSPPDARPRESIEVRTISFL